MNREELEVKAERALILLHQNAKEHGSARAQSDYLDSWVKTVLARCKQKHPGMSAAAAEAVALTDPEYIAALEARKQANEAWYSAQFLREAARAHIDAFQTASANERAMA